MGKVFVHHPLKRAELKRLFEPPPAVAPAPLPIYEAPDPEERRRRAEARSAARRQAEKDAEEERIMLTKMSRWFSIIMVDSAAFCGHLLETYELHELEHLIRTNKVKSALMGLFTPHPDKPCVHCGGHAMKKIMRGTAGIMFPLTDKFKDTEVFSFFLCEKCASLKITSIILSAMRHIREMMNGQTVAFRIRRVELTQFDADYLIDAISHETDADYQKRTTLRILNAVMK